MNKLIVILYDNDFNRGYYNTYQIFKRDSGLEPTVVLDQPTKEELLEYLQHFSSLEDTVLIHIASHGGERGICKVYSDGTNDGDINTLIYWDELIAHLNIISNKCKKLFVNLGNICNSINITNSNLNRNFDVLVTITNTMDPVTPRKLNKDLLENIDSGNINDKYQIIRKE